MKRLPIVIFTYTRLNHLKQTIAALQSNTLAPKSELFICSDGAKNGDEEKVSQLRKYIHTIKGFKKTQIIEQKENNYFTNNITNSETIIKQYGGLISLEDDIITAPGFLRFLNDAASFYKNHENVFSISGYTPPISISSNLKNDFFYLKRFNGWGNVLWASKYFKLKAFGKRDLFVANKHQLSQYGLDILDMMKQQVNNEVNANDINIMFHQFKYNMYTVYPKKSLVQNIGFDGSGIHCGITDRFNHYELWDKVDDFQFKQRIELDYDIIYSNYLFRFKFNDFVKLKLKKHILRKIDDFNIKSVALWGYNNISQYLYEFLNQNGIRVDAIIDSKAENQKMFFKDRKIETLDNVLVKNPDLFLIICAVNGTDKMLNILEQKSNKVIPLVAISKEFMKMDLE